eukprot:scaffold4.g4606.t1
MKRPLSVAETVELKASDARARWALSAALAMTLVASGERDKLKRLARERLEEAGWTEEVKQLCREFVAQRGTDVVTHAEIVSAVRSQARARAQCPWSACSGDGRLQGGRAACARPSRRPEGPARRGGRPPAPRAARGAARGDRRGSGGGMALAHVVAEDTGVAFIPQPEQQLFFDDAAGCLHLVEGRMISCLELPVPKPPRRPRPPPARPEAELDGGGGGGAAGPAADGASAAASASDSDASDSDASCTTASSATSRAFLVSEGPPVRLIRSSPDGAVTALWRSSRLVEFHDHRTGNMFVEAPPDLHGLSDGLPPASADARPSVRALSARSRARRRRGAGAGDAAALRGFFWASAPGCEFVMVTSQGLLLFTPQQPGGQGLKLQSSAALPGLQWYLYHHPTRLALAACGSTAMRLHGFQFSKQGVVRLRMLDLTPPWGSPTKQLLASAFPAARWPGKAFAGGAGTPGAGPPPPPRLELPAPLAGGEEGGTLTFSPSSQAPAALAAACVWVVRLCGRVFVARHDRPRRLLQLHRMFLDATALHHEFPVYGQQLALSVVDDVLLIHHLDSHVVLLLDIAEGPAAAPICSPLPLAVHAPPPEHLHYQQLQQHEQQLQAAQAGAPRGGQRQAPAPARIAQDGSGRLPVSSGAALLGSPSEPLPAAPPCAEGAAWQDGAAPPPAPPPGPPSQLQLHYPDWLIDAGSGAVFRLNLDLQAIADSCSDAPARLLAFLQRRRPSAAPRRDPHSISLRVLRGLVADRAPLADVRAAFDAVNAAYADALAAAGADAAGGADAGSATGTGSGAGMLSPALPPAAAAGGAAGAGAASASAGPPTATGVSVSPADIDSSVLGHLHRQEAMDPAYLHAAAAEYAASCRAHGIALAPALAELLVDTLLAQQGRAHLVGPLLGACPALDSEQLAQHLSRAAGAAGTQLALDAFARLRLPVPACRLLLRQGRVDAAARLAARAGVVGAVPPGTLLQAAARTGNLALFAGVWRACSQAAAVAAGEEGAAPQAARRQRQRRPAVPPTLEAAARQHPGRLSPAALASLASHR